MDDAERKAFRQDAQRLLAELAVETKRKLDDLGSVLQWSRVEEGDPDYALYEAANSALARGDTFVRQVDDLRREVEPNTVYFIDYSGSMSDSQLDKAYEIVRERMRCTVAHCGAIGFDTRPSVIGHILPGPQAASYLRHPMEVRNTANGVKGGGGTDAKSAVAFCDGPRLGGLAEPFAGPYAPVKKVLVSDGMLSSDDLALFDEVIVVPYEEARPEVGPTSV